MINVKILLKNIGVSNKDLMVRIVIGGTTNASQSTRVQKLMEFTFAEITNNKRGNTSNKTKGVQHMTLKLKII